jgi:hypothetical protein
MYKIVRNHKYFYGKNLTNISMLPDNNMFQLYYKEGKETILVRFSAWDLIGGLVKTLRNSNYELDRKQWGYYRLDREKVDMIIGSKLNGTN